MVVSKPVLAFSCQPKCCSVTTFYLPGKIKAQQWLELIISDFYDVERNGSHSIAVNYPAFRGSQSVREVNPDHYAAQNSSLICHCPGAERLQMLSVFVITAMWNWSRRSEEGKDKKVTKKKGARGVVLSHTEMKIALLQQLLFLFTKCNPHKSWYRSHSVWCRYACVTLPLPRLVENTYLCKWTIWLHYAKC